MLIEQVLKLEENAKNELLEADIKAKNLLAMQEEKAIKWADNKYLKWQEELAQIKNEQEKELLSYQKEMKDREDKLIKEATNIDKKVINKLADKLLKQVVK